MTKVSLGTALCCGGLSRGCRIPWVSAAITRLQTPPGAAHRNRPGGWFSTDFYKQGTL